MTANPFEAPYAEAIMTAFHGGTPAPIPLGDVVICDCCNEDLTGDRRPGGITFEGFGGVYAAGPCCAAGEEARLRRAAEPVTGRCPEGTAFADWVRAMRGPDAEIKVYRRGSR